MSVYDASSLFPPEHEQGKRLPLYIGNRSLATWSSIKEWKDWSIRIFNKRPPKTTLKYWLQVALLNGNPFVVLQIIEKSSFRFPWTLFLQSDPGLFFFREFLFSSCFLCVRSWTVFPFHESLPDFPLLLDAIRKVFQVIPDFPSTLLQWLRQQVIQTLDNLFLNTTNYRLYVPYLFSADTLEEILTQVIIPWIEDDTSLLSYIAIIHK